MMEDHQEQRDARRRSRRLWTVCVAMATTFVAQTMLLLAVPLIALQLGASPSTIGLLVAAPFIGPTLLAIPMGRLVTRFGPRAMMTVGAIGMALGPLAAVAFPTIGGLLAMQLIIGTTQVTMGISAQTVVASLGRGRASERAFGWYTTCVSAGQMLGPAVGGFLLDAASANTVFLIAAALPLLALAAARTLRVQRGTQAARPGSPFGYRAQWTLLRTNAAVQISVLLTVAVLFAFGSHAAFFPVYLESLAVSASVIGVLVSMRALASTLIRPFMAWIIASVGGRGRAIVGCIAVMALGLAATGMFETVAVLGALAVLIGIGAGLAQPLTMVTIADHVDDAERPSALGLRLTSNQAAQVVGPLSLGVIAQFAGFTAMFVVGGVALVMILTLVARRMPAYLELERVAAARHKEALS